MKWILFVSAYFDPKSTFLKAKMDIFLTFIFFFADPKMYRKSNFVHICFAHKNMNKPSQK